MIVNSKSTKENIFYSKDCTFKPPIWTVRDYRSYRARRQDNLLGFTELQATNTLLKPK